MRKAPQRRTSLRPSSSLQWVSLSEHSLPQSPSPALSTQPSLAPQKFITHHELQLTVLTQENSMLLSKEHKRHSKGRFADLEQFEKENFPGRNTAESSFMLQCDKNNDFQMSFQTELKPVSELEELAHNLQMHKDSFDSCLMKSDIVYGKQIQIINQYYKQLHLMLDVEKNKHYNNILIMKKSIDSQTKINSQMADIYLQQINCIIGKTITQFNFQLSDFEKNIRKFRDFIHKNKPKDLQIYQFELGNLDEIKTKFSKLIKIELPSIETSAPLPQRRKKAQSMEPRLKELSPMKNRIPRYSINEQNQLVIQEEGDLQYTDGQHSIEELSR